MGVILPSINCLFPPCPKKEAPELIAFCGLLEEGEENEVQVCLSRGTWNYTTILCGLHQATALLMAGKSLGWSLVGHRGSCLPRGSFNSGRNHEEARQDPMRKRQRPAGLNVFQAGQAEASRYGVLPGNTTFQEQICSWTSSLPKGTTCPKMQTKLDIRPTHSVGHR